MKYIFRKSIGVILFTILLLLSIGMCSNLLEYKEARKKYTPFFQSKTNFDVIFLGTSHMWNHVLPMELWDKYGIASYNWGYSNCTPAENYYLIQEILKYTSPKLIVLDVYGVIEYEQYNNGKYRTDRIEQQHVQFDSFPLSLNKIRAAKDLFDDYEHNEDFIWNFIMYHNRWSELDRSDFEYELNKEKGAYFLTGLGKANFSPISNSEQTVIDSVCYPYFLKTLEYCSAHNIEVLCTYLPFAAGKQQQEVANTIGNDIEAISGCKYINMLNQNILNFDTDVWNDNVHLNYSGAFKITDWLGNYIQTHYELDDYSNNPLWINDYNDYYKYKVENLKKQTLLSSYLSVLIDPDFKVQIEIYDEALLKSTVFMSLLKNAQISPQIVSKDTDACLKIRVDSNVSNELIDEAYFSYTDEKTGLLNITKIAQ